MKLIFGGAALVLIIGASEFMWIWVFHTAEIEVWEETYEAGGIKEEYQYFTHPEGQQKIKHGWYRSYYPDGTPQSTGAYRGRGKISAGEKRHGRWVYFDIHGRDSDEDIWRSPHRPTLASDPADKRMLLTGAPDV